MKKIILISSLLVLSFVVRSQVVFQKAILSPDLYPQNITQTSDGGFLIGGYNYYDSALVLKTDCFGNTLWVNNYTSGSSTMSLLQAGECVSGGYYIFGEIQDSAFVLIKTTINGNILWTKTLPNTELGYGFSKIRSTADGGFLISESFYTKMGALKLDANGNVLWHKSFSDDPNDQSVKCPSFNCFISNDGSMLFSGKRMNDILLVKADSSGSLMWSTTLWSGGYFHTYGITSTADGGYVVCGVNLISNGNLYPFVMKINSAGSLLWYNEVIVSNAVGFNEVYEQTNGNLVAVGTDFDSITVIVTFNSNGIALTSKSFQNNICYGFPSMCLTSDGGFIIATNYFDQTNNSDAFVLMKTDTAGNFPCDFNNSLVTHNSAQVVPAALNVPIYTQTFSTIAYGSTYNAISANPIITDYCTLFSMNTWETNTISIFPSPVSSGENIHIVIEGMETSAVSIYDANGKLVQIIGENVNSSLEISTAEMHAGIYFIRVTDADEELIRTSRFIVR